MSGVGKRTLWQKFQLLGTEIPSVCYLRGKIPSLLVLIIFLLGNADASIIRFCCTANAAICPRNNLQDRDRPVESENRKELGLTSRNHRVKEVFLSQILIKIPLV